MTVFIEEYTKHNVYDTDGWNLILFFGFYDTGCPKV